MVVCATCCYSDGGGVYLQKEEVRMTPLPSELKTLDLSIPPSPVKSCFSRVA